MMTQPRITEVSLKEMSPRLLWVGLVGGLLLRLLFWIVLGDKLPVHGYESGVISDNVVAGRGYFMPFYYCDVPIRSFIPPLYPMLMALFKMITPHWVTCLRILQIVASLGNALLAASLAGRWFGRRAMNWSYLLVLLYPVFAVYCLSIFSTTFIMTFALILMNIMDRIDGPQPIRLGAKIGLIHGLAILTSPPLALLGVLFLFRLWRFRSPGRLKRTVAYLVVLGLVWSPWIIRNFQVHGTLMLTSTNGGFNFMVGNNPYAAGYTWGDFTEEENFWKVVDRSSVERLSEPELEAWFYQRALSYIQDDPLHYLKLLFKKAYYFWWCRDVSRFGYPTVWSQAYQMIYGLFLPFIILGIWSWRWRWRRLLPAFFLFIEYTCLYSAYFVRSRFRWEIEPILLIFAVVGWFEVARLLRSNKKRGSSA
ncbi:MAG: glycosyltransferase family 39 protein [bacterium]|nr:glycosyltransferase family 39 protein [bacterium]